MVKLHEEIQAPLASGGSEHTAFDQITKLRRFFAWADRMNRQLTMESAVETYCVWADWLVHRVSIKRAGSQNRRDPDRRFISMNSAYLYGSTVGMLLDRVLGRHTHLIEMTRLHKPGQRKTVVGVQAEKQNLMDTFRFGHLLQDICDALNAQNVLEAPLPFSIELRSGKQLVRHGHKVGVDSLVGDNWKLGERYPLANLRIEAELMMFIGQTGMNLGQAHNLELRQFFYVSHLDGYQVKDHKGRRGGPVFFEIFKDYKPHFERYLAWRTRFFPSSNRLFPFVRTGEISPKPKFLAERLRKICKELDMPLISPRSLRNTRVNWLLRKTADPDLTAEMAQHTKATLLGVYDRPSLQRAMVEVTRFWAEVDPHGRRTESVAPGGCTGLPKPVPQIPPGAPRPDCSKGSGCLWCENHRDVDSQDYVWSLASFGHLKLIELSKANLPQREDDVPPAKHAVERICEKLKWFERSNEARSVWVSEAHARITEGEYHPDWRGQIADMEGAT